MAVNTKEGSRRGAVRQRSQVFNPATGVWVKRDADSGKFVAGKKDGTPFKGVKKEKTSVKANPSVTKSIAIKAEKSVKAYLESKAKHKR